MSSPCETTAANDKALLEFREVRPAVAVGGSDQMQYFVGACATRLGGTTEMAVLASKRSV